MNSFELATLQAFLMLNRLQIEGRRRAVALLTEGKSAAETLEQIVSEGLLSTEERTPVFDASKEITLCLEKGIGFLNFMDPAYPDSLKEIPDPPLLLYRKGTLIEDDRNAVAIVGTRHPSFYGREQAQKFSQGLAAKGMTIVSGLARGIDQVAHEGALRVSYGRTIAVMGCGLDTVYPKEHEALFRRIAEQGAVLSEYPVGTPPLPENFPRRNRILSGLAYATLVIEAHSRSGSLITAHQAAEQGREVFALPGPVDRLTSRGTHQLIKEGACLVETPEEILLALADRLKLENPPPPASFALPALSGPQFQEQPETPDTGEKAKKANEETPFVTIPVEEVDVIEALLKDEGPLSPEEILEFTGLDPAGLPVLLLRMELAKRIRKAQDGRYSLR